MCKPNVNVYHANDRLKVENFLETNELIISKDTNWLGKGMYFWDNLSNARYWKNEKLRKKGYKNNKRNNLFRKNVRLNR